MAERVRITDVSPRDGLQNEPGIIDTDEKIRLVELLLEATFDEVEVSSFVSPRWVPQLGDAAAVFELIGDLIGGDGRGGTIASALVPNEKGMVSALKVNEAAGRHVISKVAVFTAASETFSQKNTNASIEQSLERFVPVAKRAKDAGVLLRGYISCAIACPYEGDVRPEEVSRIAARLVEIGADEIDVADTIGAGTPETVVAMLDAVLKEIGEERLAVRESERTGGVESGLTLHLHDTSGRAADCVRAALGRGVRSFDGAVGGLGGCPFASEEGGERAPGNIAMAVLLDAIHSAGYETSVDAERLPELAWFAEKLIREAATGEDDFVGGGVE